MPGYDGLRSAFTERRVEKDYLVLVDPAATALRAELIFHCVKWNGLAFVWPSLIRPGSRPIPLGDRLPRGRSMPCWPAGFRPVASTKSGCT